MNDRIFQYQISYSMLDQEYAVYGIFSDPQTPAPPPLSCYQSIDILQDMEAQANAFMREDFYSDPDITNLRFKGFFPRIIAAPNDVLANDQPTLDQAELLKSESVQSIQIRQGYQSGERLDETPTQSSLEEYEERQVPKKYKLTLGKKGKKTKRDPYPTKNFLPSFRASFLSYLKKHYENPEEFEQFEVVKRIRGKRCINMQDYNDLFLVGEFRPVLKQYFKNQVIMRDLFQSRIDYKTKLEYFKRIHVFEDAFNNGSFKKINY